MQNQASFWDKTAKKYAAQPIGNMDAYTETLVRTRTYLHPDHKVLELGCGTGTTALRLADAVTDYTASDVSPKMIEIGQEKARAQNATNVTFKAADVFDPSLDGTYDAVMAFNLIHLIEDTDGALTRIKNLLKPGGVLISKTPCRPGKGSPLKWRLMLTILPVLQWLGKAPFVNLMVAADWDKAVEKSGLKIVETGDYPVNPRSHFIVAKKV